MKNGTLSSNITSSVKSVWLPTWQQCRECLRDELPAQQFNTWIKPLVASGDERGLQLMAPNRFIRDWVSDKFLPRILELVSAAAGGQIKEVQIGVIDPASQPEQSSVFSLDGNTTARVARKNRRDETLLTPL